MSLATGGRAIGATSTRSSSASRASCKAISIFTIPTCSPAGPTSRTSGTRMRSLIRGSVLICPPYVCQRKPGACADNRSANEPEKLKRASARCEDPSRPRSDDTQAGRPRRLTRRSMCITRVGDRVSTCRSSATPDRSIRTLPPGDLFPGLPVHVRGRNCPSELVLHCLHQPVARGQLVEHDALNGQRVRSRWVDQESRGALGQRCLGGEVQSYRNRARAFLPNLQ